MDKQEFINEIEAALKLIKADTNEKFTFKQLMYISGIFPDAIVDQVDELGGEIVIFTGLKETTNGSLRPHIVDELEENN